MSANKEAKKVLKGHKMTETDGMRPDVTGVAAVINIFNFPCDQSYKRSTIVLYNTMVVV